MVKRIIPGKEELGFLTVEQFVENIINQFGFTTLLNEEHIAKTDKLKKYNQYENGREVKDELANMLNSFVKTYERNDYICKISFNASKKPGLSNYIEITFNTPFGSKEWLRHMKIRVSDHPKHNDRKIDEYIYIEGKSVENIEKDLDKIINKRIRRLQREDQLPTAQNESIRRNNNMKLRINEEINMTKSEARKYALNLFNDAVHIANQELDCDGEMIAKISKQGNSTLEFYFTTPSGKFTSFSEFLFMFSRKYKCQTKFYVTVKKLGEIIYYEAGFGGVTTTFGGGLVGGTYQEINSLDDLKSFIMNELLSTVVSNVNKAYKVYKKGAK